MIYQQAKGLSADKKISENEASINIGQPRFHKIYPC